METRIGRRTYAALRTGEGAGYRNGRGSAFLTFGQDGIHGHCDRLSFTAFARASSGRDPEAGERRAQVLGARPERANRTPSVTHANGTGESRPGAGEAAARGFRGQPGRRWPLADGGACIRRPRMRTLAVTEQGILDFTAGSLDARHTFDYLFHGVGIRGVSRAAERWNPKIWI